jgi:nitronate monooxygenase
MNDFCRRFEMNIPVVLAPMGGGPSTPELAAAVSSAGGLGSLAAAYSSPEKITEDIARIRKLTKRPFVANLFSPAAQEPLRGDVEAVSKFLGNFHQRLGLAAPQFPSSAIEDFEKQIDAICASKPAAVSFTFGLLPPETIERLKTAEIFVIGTATTVDEARQLERAGVDGIVAQGGEAGAHRGTFAVPAEQALIGTVALIPQVLDAVRVPVIASGGIMDGRGIVAALALGASAVQMGTAFLAAKEAGTSAAYREALLKAREDQTTVTRAFSGRMARGIQNEFITKWNQSGLANLSYPWQNAFTQQMRRAASAAKDAGLLSLWAGQGVGLIREGTAADLISRWRREMKAALQSLSRNAEEL